MVSPEPTDVREDDDTAHEDGRASDATEFAVADVECDGLCEDEPDCGDCLRDRLRVRV